MKKSESNIVYTDIKHDDLPEFKFIELRNMVNISPNRKEQKTGSIEQILFNF